MTSLADIIEKQEQEYQAPKTRVAILGATGSIGTQALDVCKKHADKLEVVALTCNSHVEEVVRSARQFNVARIAIADTNRKDDPALANLPDTCEVSFGFNAINEVALQDDVDVVLVALVGAVGMWATAAALKANKRVALANKESLVVAGDIIMPLAKHDQLIPVDSEHSAIFQCYQGENPKKAHNIWLTCSGGPFFGMPRNRLKHMTVENALSHPTWSMGNKVTIDSSTLMNKGLECIEAHHLFDVPMDFIKVLIQPQSKIHSMVEYDDGSVIAHLGTSDMRIPIQYSFSYPDRWETPCERTDFRNIGKLDFGEPDLNVFRCLQLAYDAGNAGGTLPAVMNAANEVAVEAFLNKRCRLTDIDYVVAQVMDKHDTVACESIGQLWEIDQASRALAEKILNDKVR